MKATLIVLFSVFTLVGASAQSPASLEKALSYIEGRLHDPSEKPAFAKWATQMRSAADKTPAASPALDKAVRSNAQKSDPSLDEATLTSLVQAVQVSQKNKLYLVTPSSSIKGIWPFSWFFGKTP